MTDPRTLATLLQHVQAERDRVRSAWLAAAQGERAAQAQAQQLREYRGEYHARWSERFAQAGTPELLRCWHEFAQRLDQAIAHQQQQCRHAAARCTQVRSELVAREQRVAAVRKLGERRALAERRQADRRDQRDTDEAAQRLAQLRIRNASDCY